MKFLSKKQRDILVFNVGSNYISGFIFEKSKDKNIVKKFYREDLSEFGIFNGAKKEGLDLGRQSFDAEVVEKTLGRLIEKSGLSMGINELPCLVGVSSHFLKAKIIETRYQREKWNFPINKEEEKIIHEAVFQDARDKTSEFLRDKSNYQEGEVFFSRIKIVSTKISGYNVVSIFGCEGKDLIFKTLVVFCSNSYFDFLKGVFGRFGLKNFQIVHEVEGLMNCSRFFAGSNKIFIDIDVDVTRVFSFCEHPDWVADFKYGSRDCSKAISNILGITEKQATALKDDYSRGFLSEEASARLKAGLEPVISQWLANLNASIGGLDTLAPKVFLFGVGSVLKGIDDGIRGQNNFTGLEIKFLTPEFLPVENKSGVDFSNSDTSSLLLSYVELRNAKN